MTLEATLGIVAACWLAVSFILMARSIFEGRALADALAERHPDAYETLGRPRPGFFLSARRSRFSRYVAQREFEDLADGALVARFEAYRRAEARLVLSVLASGGAIALLALAAHYAA